MKPDLHLYTDLAVDPFVRREFLTANTGIRDTRLSQDVDDVVAEAEFAACTTCCDPGPDDEQSPPLP